MGLFTPERRGEAMVKAKAIDSEFLDILRTVCMFAGGRIDIGKLTAACAGMPVATRYNAKVFEKGRYPDHCIGLHIYNLDVEETDENKLVEFTLDGDKNTAIVVHIKEDFAEAHKLHTSRVIYL